MGAAGGGGCAGVVLALEIKLPSLRLGVNREMTNERKARICLVELESLNEESFVAQPNLVILTVDIK